MLEKKLYDSISCHKKGDGNILCSMKTKEGVETPVEGIKRLSMTSGEGWMEVNLKNGEVGIGSGDGEMECDSDGDKIRCMEIPY